MDGKTMVEEEEGVDAIVNDDDDAVMEAVSVP